MKSHIFITSEFLNTCMDNNLFGVSSHHIHFLSNVEVGDTAFLLETDSHKIVGPYSIIGDADSGALFFDDTLIWEKESKLNTDKFKYRVQLQSDELYEADLSILWDLLLIRDQNSLFLFSTFQRSNNTLLKGEGELLKNLIIANGRELNSIEKKLINNKKIVDLFKGDKIHFTSEARLESYLIKNKSKFLKYLSKICKIEFNENYELINQLTLPGLNYNIDIALLNKANNDVILIELKKDDINEFTLKQLLRYEKYWKNPKTKITLIAIGTKFYTPQNEVEKNIIQIKYQITEPKEPKESKKIKLTTKEGDEISF